MPLIVCERGWRGRSARDEGRSADRPRHLRRCFPEREGTWGRLCLERSGLGSDYGSPHAHPVTAPLGAQARPGAGPRAVSGASRLEPVEKL